MVICGGQVVLKEFGHVPHCWVEHVKLSSNIQPVMPFDFLPTDFLPFVLSPF